MNIEEHATDDTDTDIDTDADAATNRSTAFPFTAIVEQESLKTALVLNAINPDVGGVLVRGERGTAKSTTVRALAEVLPDRTVVADCPYGCPPTAPDRMCPDCAERYDADETLPTTTEPMRVVDLPLNATADRLVGTLDLERAVTDGTRQFEPGILAEANRNVLYVDEVNLLDDHLVDVLLDAAAMGENVVEREGVSVRHPAEFMLVGTMNPEEGSLRPQLLDRFGLVVDVAGIDDVDQRVEISRRRAAFDADPQAFRAEYQDDQRDLTERITAARERLPDVTVPEPIEKAIAAINVHLEVDGHRGDNTLRRAARALAAYRDEPTVSIEHVEAVAELVLTHRLTKLPFEDTEMDVDAAVERARREYVDD